MRYTAIIDGRRLEIQLTRNNDRTVEAEISGERYCLDVDSVEPGVYWIRLNNRSIEVSVTPNGEAYVVSMAGRNAEVEILDARAVLWQGRVPQRIEAPLRHDGDQSCRNIGEGAILAEDHNTQQLAVA